MIWFKKYSPLVVVLLLFSACARQDFEWIKINPDKLILASKTEPYYGDVKNVAITLDLKEKENPIYYDSPSDYVKNTAPEKPTPIIMAPKEAITNKSFKNITPLKKVNSKKVKSNSEKATPKVVSKETKSYKINPPKKKPIKSLVPKKNVIEPAAKPVIKPKAIIAKSEKKNLDLSANKLNGALKIPAKQNVENHSKSNIKTHPNSSTTRQQVEKTPKVLTNNLVKSVQEPTIQKQVKVEAESTQVKNLIKVQKGNNFMWAGLVLAVVGVVMGLIFGRSAYLISAVGFIFAIIGFIIRT